MKRHLLCAPTLALILFGAACSDSPLEPESLDREPIAAESHWAAPAATDAQELQKALDDAATSGKAVVVRGVIELSEPLTYQSNRTLRIVGQRGARIVGPSAAIATPSNSGMRVGEETVGDALQILGEPDLSIRNVSFVEQSGHGIYFELTDDARGRVDIELNGVSFREQGLSAMWVEDQQGGSQASPDPINSDASLHLDFVRVRVQGTGFAEDDAQSCRGLAETDGCSWADFDGVRINEGGAGDITYRFRNVTFEGNAGDGVELDEKGAGDVVGAVYNSTFNKNGEQPQFPADLEDGFDIDEEDEGGIRATFIGVHANDNIDEGIDLDEVGNGDAHIVAFSVVATGNSDENIKVTESDPEVDGSAPQGGDIIVHFWNVKSDASLAGRGARFEEFGDGNVRGSMTRSSFSNNSNDDGLRIDEDGAGSVQMVLRDVTTNRNDGQGIQMTENGGGDILLSLSDSEAIGNDNTAVELEEEDEGGHEVTISRSHLVANDGEESLDVIEGDAGGSTVTIRRSTLTPDPVSSGDVVFN